MLARVLTEAGSLCHAEIGFAVVLEGDLFRMVAGVGATAEHWDYQFARPFAVTRETVGGRVAPTDDSVHWPICSRRASGTR